MNWFFPKKDNNLPNVEDKYNGKALKMAEEIAKDILHIETLETRGRDNLDFHELHVQAIKTALVLAYVEGLLGRGKK